MVMSRCNRHTSARYLNDSTALLVSKGNGAMKLASPLSFSDNVDLSSSKDSISSEETYQLINIRTAKRQAIHTLSKHKLARH